MNRNLMKSFIKNNYLFYYLIFLDKSHCININNFENNNLFVTEYNIIKKN